MRFVKSIRQ